MGEQYPPTAADYAMSAAQDAAKKASSNAGVMLRLLAAVRTLAEGGKHACLRELDELEVELRKR